MRKYVIALYIRLSVEDIKTESLSIPNQRLILREKAMSLPEWDNGEVLEFVDNGHTGTNFERPAVQELLTMVQAGVSTVSLSKTYPGLDATALRPVISSSGCFRSITPGLSLSATILTPSISKEIPEGLMLPLSILSASATAVICP